MGRLVKVILQPITYRKRSHVAIVSPNNSDIDAVVREMSGAQWSSGYHFWHMPLYPKTLNELATNLKGIATVDRTAFKNIKIEKVEIAKPKIVRRKKEKISLEQEANIKKYCNNVLAKSYKEGSIKVYSSLLVVFFGQFKEKSDTDITKEDVKFFFSDYVVKNNLKKSYVKLMASTLRQYFQYLGKDELFND